MQQVTAAHVTLCTWLREVALAIVRAEGITPPSYTWDDDWFPFKYGLGGEEPYNENPRDEGEARYQACIAEGRAVREKLSAYAQETLSDLCVTTPASPGYVEHDDFLWLRNTWGIITEAAWDLGLPAPPEVEWLVTNEELPDALNL